MIIFSVIKSADYQSRISEYLLVYLHHVIMISNLGKNSRGKKSRGKNSREKKADGKKGRRKNSREKKQPMEKKADG